MSPQAPSKPEEMAEAIGKWLGEPKYLINHGDDCKISMPFRVAALQTLMGGFKDQFETSSGH